MPEGGIASRHSRADGNPENNKASELINSKSELIASIDDEFQAIIPEHSEPNHAAMGYALGAAAGVIEPDTFDDATRQAAQKLIELIGEPEHVVLLLLDGFGMNYVDTLPNDSLLREHVATTMCSTLPTSTGPNLMALATGRWPGSHGNLGWDVHIPRLGERIQPLPWRLTRTGQPLQEVGFSPMEMLLAPPIPFRNLGSFNFVVKDDLANSTTTQMYGQTSTLGFSVEDDPISEIVNLVTNTLDRAVGRSFTYVYWNEVDSAAHKYGELHPVTRVAVRRATALTEALIDALAGKCRFLATADHGHLDSPEDVWTPLTPSSSLSRYLSCVPAGEPRALYFNTRTGADDAFSDAFLNQLGDRFALMRSNDAADMGLFGPPEWISDVGRARLGDFFALSRGRWSIYASDTEEVESIQSMHGGITTAESIVPLIVV